MQCEDNSKVRIPLSEVCQTTDIGCVPETNGKPDCNPQPDELPIAFDPSTTTLWLFSCKTREWVAMSKFQMCELSALNLDNITNICDILNIGVYFDAGSGCQQGTVTLAELAEKILDCLKLETKIITIGEGEGNKVKVSIDGLPLDPVYVQGKNIWSEGGSGTEADPLVVATYDPICKWPTKTQAQVDAATTKHLGACLDGEMARVPFPSKVCELPSRNQAQVDVAGSVELAACVDGEGVKIPYTKPSPPVCEANQITLEQANDAGSNLTIVGCNDGDVVRIPVSGSGFFDRDYICVPQVIGVPQGVPAQGTGPLRMGCSGELYVWLCDQNKWQVVEFGNHSDLPWLNANNVPDICNNFRMLGWYSSNQTECAENVQFTLRQLINLITKCGGNTIEVIGENVNYKSCIVLTNVEEKSVLRGRDWTFVRGSGTIIPDRSADYGNRYVEINYTNNNSVKGLLSIDVRGLVHSWYYMSIDMVISDQVNIRFHHPSYEFQEGIQGTYHQNFPFPGTGSDDESDIRMVRRGVGGVLANAKIVVNPGETIKRYVQYFLIFQQSAEEEAIVDVRTSVDAIFYPMRSF